MIMKKYSEILDQSARKIFYNHLGNNDMIYYITKERSLLNVLSQELKTPMPADHMLPIWEECKDMGLLLGKGGLYGNVSMEKI